MSGALKLHLGFLLATAMLPAKAFGSCDTTIWFAISTLYYGPTTALPPWSDNLTYKVVSLMDEKHIWKHAQTRPIRHTESFDIRFENATYILFSYPTSCGELKWSPEATIFMGRYTDNGKVNVMLGTRYGSGQPGQWNKPVTTALSFTFKTSTPIASTTQKYLCAFADYLVSPDRPVPSDQLIDFFLDVNDNDLRITTAVPSVAGESSYSNGAHEPTAEPAFGNRLYNNFSAWYPSVSTHGIQSLSLYKELLSSDPKSPYNTIEVLYDSGHKSRFTCQKRL